jgi:phenylalanyl-tRNA synthetase beta chain
MKVSYSWLNSFFDEKLPKVEDVVDALMFHSWEVEDEEKKGEDIVFDVKVLPDKSAWALSHRGIAKDLGVVLHQSLSRDSLTHAVDDTPHSSSLSVRVEDEKCTRYHAAVIRGISVGPSPSWLKERLESLGQRSINNIVDATNYVMFDMGQPLHAFDADKLGTRDGKNEIVVRAAKDEETITTLTGETYTLTLDDLLIVDSTNDTPIGIAGVKGGKHAEVDSETRNIIIEAANFNSVSTRKSSQRLKLRTDASARFENGIVPELTVYALNDVTKLIVDIAGGTLEGIALTPFTSAMYPSVSVSVQKIEHVLGVAINEETVRDIMERFGYEYTLENGTVTVIPPFERSDLVIPEDLIEEVGRMYGYEHVPSVIPEPLPLPELNKRFYYSEKVREALTSVGFSEVHTSSFREHDTVKMKNAFASDKGYLRSSLRENLIEAMRRNVPNKDLLGIPFVGIFEIGTVFGSESETYALALGVRHGMDYKAKTDDVILDGACVALHEALKVELSWKRSDGVAELDLGALLEVFPNPTQYEERALQKEITFQSFSAYPAISRDVALWVSEGTESNEVEGVLNAEAGDLRIRTTLFDEFKKDGKTSYAFRLVFQSNSRTLTDDEINNVMEQVYKGVSAKGWEVR